MDKRLMNKLILGEFVRLVADEFIGNGSTRSVYGSSAIPDVVFKFEPTARSFANVAEWDFFGDFNEEDHVRQWLAPCLGISPCGIVLMQARCTPLDLDRLPKQIPGWTTDVKLSNWGMYEDKEFGHRPVMVDYNLTVANPSKRMKRAFWTNA